MNRKETNIKLKNRFAINLKKYRKENEMTQKKLSETSNVDLQALYRYENGTSEASAINAYKIATAMNITIEKLFEDEEKNNTKKIIYS
jgi:transcriptional regulator with XRE-family HTH domain